MKRILIVTSCTGEKTSKPENQLTLKDFQKGGPHLKTREKELTEFRKAASELYTGQQHLRLMRGVNTVSGNNNGTPVAEIDLWVLSAGYGLVPGKQKLAPYECTFLGMKAKQLRDWADEINAPQDFRKVVADKYDLGLILLGDGYLKACNLDDKVELGGPTILFCGNGMSKSLPRIPRMRIVTLSNPEASRFSCGLVGLKGELAHRILDGIANKKFKLDRWKDPTSDLLGDLEVEETTGTKKTKTVSKKAEPTKRKTAVPNPKVDKVIKVPKSWWKSEHKQKLRYFIPEWDDLVDPDYNFLTDTHASGASDWSNETYAHQMFDSPNYDGLLMSRVVAEKSAKKKVRINQLGVHRLLRVPREYPVMGDCGAFGYINETVPPYTTADVLDYYSRLDFDLGVSVDHLIVTATEENKKFRYDLTIANAEDFLKEHRKRRLDWTPIGAVQGWDPKSYAKAAKNYVDMGYTYIGLGGLVRSSTKNILAVLQEVSEVVPQEVSLHLFGLARLNAINEFAKFGVNTVDSASYLRQAWMRDSQGYLTTQGSYSAIRVPEIGKSFRAKRMLEESGVSHKTATALEKSALNALRRLDKGKCSVRACLDAVFEYEVLFGRETAKHETNYQKTLSEKPWKKCSCPICSEVGIEVVIFRGNNRNRRRGFHNTFVFYQLLQNTLTNDTHDVKDKQLGLFTETAGTA